MKASSTIVVYHRKLKKYFGGNGWVDRLPFFLITRYDTVRDAQDVCDAFQVADADYDREKARDPRHKVCEVQDLQKEGVAIEPPPLTDNKYVFERQWPTS